MEKETSKERQKKNIISIKSELKTLLSDFVTIYIVLFALSFIVVIVGAIVTCLF